MNRLFLFLAMFIDCTIGYVEEARMNTVHTAYSDLFIKPSNEVLEKYRVQH